MPKVILESAPLLMAEELRSLFSPRQGIYWLAKCSDTLKIEKFIDLPRHARISANNPLRVELTIPRGDYLLGAGSGKLKRRVHYHVDEFGIFKITQHLL